MLPLELTLALAASSSARHIDFTVPTHARRREKSRRQSAARRTTLRSRIARQSAVNLASFACDSRHAITRPSPGLTPSQKAATSGAHASDKKASYRTSSDSSTSRRNTSSLHWVESSRRLSLRHCSTRPPPHSLSAQSFARSSSHISDSGASREISSACSI